MLDAGFEYALLARPVTDVAEVCSCLLLSHRYELAWQFCQPSFEALQRIEHGAPTYGPKRASCVQAIASGYTPKCQRASSALSRPQRSRPTRTLASKCRCAGPRHMVDSCSVA